MPPKHQSYIYASNDLTDEFLFGDDIMINQVQTKKKKKKSGPKSFVSDTVSSLSDERAITESSSQMNKSLRNQSCVIMSKKPPVAKSVQAKNLDEMTIIKSKINDACNFPKTLSYQNKDIYVDVKKLTSNVRKIETLTQ